MLKSVLAAVAVAAIITMPALAQSENTVNKGQVLKVLPDGKFSVGQMNMDPKMQNEMKKRAKKLPKGLVIWRADDGQMRFLDNPVDPSSMK
jgi:hypothetical protein